MVSYNSQLCSHADGLYLAFETADKAEVKMHFVIHVKAWQTLSYYSSMQYYYYYYIQGWMEVSGEFDTPVALTPEKELPFLLDRLLGGLQGLCGKLW